MENFKLFLRQYLNPPSAMSDIIDRGSWAFGAGAVLIVAAGFYLTIEARPSEVYRLRTFQEFYQVDRAEKDSSAHEARYNKAVADFQAATNAVPKIPVVGDK